MKNLTIAIVLVLVASFTYSCRTNQQNKLIGTWKYIPHTKPDSSTVRIWIFYSGSELEVVDLVDSDSTIRTYSYSIEGSELNIFGDDTDLGPYLPSPNEYRGKYWVDDLNKEVLKIEKTEHGDGSDGNAYLRVDLVKQ